MLVCEVGDCWQIVLMPDHADLAGGLARAWAERTDRTASLITAAERHDDGWAVWEQSPLCDLITSTPLNFDRVGMLTRLSLYRAGISVVSEEDAYAGLLVSMHYAGIYRGRYGGEPGLNPTFGGSIGERIDAFVAEQEGVYDARGESAGVGQAARWHDYGLLELYDRISLLFCMNDALAPFATEFSGYRLEPSGPGVLRMTPFPFEGSGQEFSLVRRLVPKRRWRDQAAFRAAFVATEPEPTSIRICA